MTFEKNLYGCQLPIVVQPNLLPRSVSNVFKFNFEKALVSCWWPKISSSIDSPSTKICSWKYELVWSASILTQITWSDRVRDRQKARQSLPLEGFEKCNFSSILQNQMNFLYKYELYRLAAEKIWTTKLKDIFLKRGSCYLQTLRTLLLPAVCFKLLQLVQKELFFWLSSAID